MKAKLTSLALGVVFVAQMAAAQSTNALATANTSTEKPQSAPAYKLEHKTKVDRAEDRSKILRLEGMSSQPWAVVSARRSDPAIFHSGREPDTRLYVCLVGSERQR
jgi:hypothetical protein